MYGQQFRQKLATFMHINVNFCTTPKYFSCDTMNTEQANENVFTRIIVNGIINMPAIFRSTTKKEQHVVRIFNHKNLNK